MSEAASAPSQEETIYSVLYLNSYHRGHLWSDGIEQGLREGLIASGKQVDLYVEFLDTQRFPEGEHLAALARTLAVKHRRIRYDVIAASDNNAFDFALQYRSRLFPGTPLVFCGYNSFRPEVLKGIANVTGINEEIDFQGAIDMALSIHPKTKTLVFVTSDYYSSGQRNQACAETMLIPAYREHYDVIQFKNLYLRELEQRLSGLPPHALVFVFGGPLDNRDQEFIPSSEYYRRVAAASTAPAYSFWDFTLNTGMMGGSIITGIEQGRMVAEMTLKILDGVPTDAIPVVMDAPTSTIFDFQAMRRFGVSERSLPPKGSVILNQPETFYQKYKRYVWIAIIAFMTLFTLALSLAFLLRQSRRLEGELRQHREHLQEEVAERTAELRQANDSLRESEEKYRMLIEYSNDVIWTLDLNGNFTYVSPSVFRLRGFTPEEVIRQPIEEAICPGSLPAVQAGFRLAFETIASGQDNNPPEYFEIEQPRRDGTTVWTEATARLMYNAAGQPIGLVGVSRDITERKRMETALRTSEANLKRAQKIAHIGNWEWDLVNNTDACSEEVYWIFGVDPDHVDEGFHQPEQRIRRFIHPDDRESVLRVRQQVSSATQGVLEYRVICPNGDMRHVCDQWEISYNARGQPVRVFGILQDITLRKQMEVELVQKKEQAEAAERTKSTFFANASHHLRTPLNVILGFADLMADDATLAPTYQEYLALIRQNGKDLLALINQMLAVSKLQPDEIADDEASQQLIDVLEDHRPQATLTPQAECRLTEFESDTLRRRIREIPEEMRSRLIEATQNLDIGLMSYTIEQIRQTQPAVADTLERLTRNFEYETILNTLNLS